MATFIGFNTINQKKKFTLTDFELVKRDLLNALNIQRGQKTGKPEYGTLLWSFLFENQGPEFVDNVRREIERVAAADPRVSITDIRLYPQDNGIRAEIDCETTQSNGIQLLNVFFDLSSSTAGYV